MSNSPRSTLTTRHPRPARIAGDEDGWHVSPNGGQGSHILTSLLGVQALALVPEDRELRAAGEPVDIEFLG